jgi:lysophospholipid acyltransferase (LPLAT)-like uncharacterized protein
VRSGAEAPGAAAPGAAEGAPEAPGWKGVVLPPLARCFIRALGGTVGVTVEGEGPLLELEARGKAAVLPFFHGRQFLLINHLAGRRVTVISSLSRDGELQARTLAGLGFSIVRGSSSRGGARALLGMARLMEQGVHASFAVDGPRGPLHRVKPGAVYLAKRMRAPLVPMAASASPAWVLHRAWDRYQLPRPFARGAVLFGAPFHADGDLSEQAVERDRAELERRMLELLGAADARVGVVGRASDEGRNEKEDK